MLSVFCLEESRSAGECGASRRFGFWFDGLLSIWIRAATAAVMLGWVLSALGALDGRGYLIAGVIVVALLLAGWRGVFPTSPRDDGCLPGSAGISARESEQVDPRGQDGPGRTCHDAPRYAALRCCWRPLPFLFLLALVLTVVGSILYEPDNFDGLSYRIPRVLHWLTEHRWHWANVPYQEINYMLPNYEWLTVPFYLATGSFHSTVVINWIAFLLVPPLFFSLLRAFGTPLGTAYDWMWILPLGYLIALQAGGIGNDLLGLTMILAALHCAWRFNRTDRGVYLFDAVLAAAFCTGIKASNIPLAGFVLIILLRGPGRLLAHRFALGVSIVLGALCSAIVPMALNWLHTGSVLGAPPGQDQVQELPVGWIGNGLILGVSMWTPPICPGAAHVSDLMERSLGRGLGSWLHAHYKKFELGFSELPQDSGLGLGVTLALLLSVLLWAVYSRCESKVQSPKSKVGQTAAARRSSPQFFPWQIGLYWAWLGFSLLVLLGRLGTGPAFPRNVLPWYPLLLAPLLARIGGEHISRSKIWRIAAPLAVFTVIPPLILTPERPILPSSVVLNVAAKCGVKGPALERARIVYDTYQKRPNPFGELLEALPPGLSTLGLVTDGQEPTSAWWLGRGKRKCVYLLTEDQVAQARAKQDPAYVVLRDRGCQLYFHSEIAEWVSTHRATEIKTAHIRIRAREEPATFALVKLEQ
ncbi:MAG: hypothetical protein C5B50_16925 [Verrucomicrobia bacterium]|nr:MAG: hypothetical protein C5B50_16925 [Verrucomicrobiota bacterium]